MLLCMADWMQKNVYAMTRMLPEYYLNVNSFQNGLQRQNHPPASCLLLGVYKLSYFMYDKTRQGLPPNLLFALSEC